MVDGGTASMITDYNDNAEFLQLWIKVESNVSQLHLWPIQLVLVVMWERGLIIREQKNGYQQVVVHLLL